MFSTSIKVLSKRRNLRFFTMILFNVMTFIMTEMSLAVFFPITVTSFSFATSRNACLFGFNAPVRKTSTPCAPRIPVMAAHVKEDNENKESSFRRTETSNNPVPFIDPETGSFIECYVDSIATVNAVDYSIGSPCDYSVALCYFDKDGQLNPVELDDVELMDEVFPVAEEIVEDEFGEELALIRTPQTLTLVGELELDDEDNEYDEDEDDDLDFEEDDMGDSEEEVEILLSFEHDDKEFNLVRLLDPVLLVAKPDEKNPLNRQLLSSEESDSVMPFLEDMILKYQEETDDTS